MLLIMGLGAGVTEELFFRGLLMPLIARSTGNVWIGIILSGIIFGAMHGNFYDIVPISLIGILFGYVYYRTGNLWITIFIHSFYNSFQVKLNYMYNVKMISFNIDELEHIPLWIIAICLPMASYFYVKIISNRNYE